MIIRTLSVVFFLHTLLLAAKEINPVYTNTPPKIDGIITENEWTGVTSTTGFTQLQPHKGAPASEETIVFVQQNANYLFVAFQCVQQNSSDIVANISRRDRLDNSDDAVLLLLDTFNDKRSAVAFWVNPLGTQTDLFITDDGRNADLNWDTEWQAAAHIADTVWTAEMAIPFDRIRYKNGLQTWGINFARVIRANVEIAYWSGELYDNYRVSQSGTLTGLKVPEKSKSFRLTPYATLRFENGSITQNHNKWLADAGLDASYQLTTGVRVDASLNPDFATVEGDQEQINLTRWELSFPEKRLFFLEGNSLYSTRIRTFYSRRIGDIDYGVKVIGKLNDYNFSALSARTAADVDLAIPSAQFTAARLKKDVLNSSSIGLTAVDKSWSTGYSRSLSGDFLINPGEAWQITGQFVVSAPGLSIAHSAYFLRVAHESNLHHIHLRYSDTGEKLKDNVNQTGFIRDDDMRELDSDLSYFFWPQSSALKYIFIESRNNIFWSHAGMLRSWYVTETARFYLKNRFSIQLSYNDEFKLYEQKYYNHQYQIQIGYNTDEWQAIKGDYTWGRNFDRDFELYSFGIQHRFFEHLALGYDFQSISFVPDATVRSNTIHILSVDYNVTRDLWFRVFTQTSITEKRLYIYGLFGWRFFPPFSSLYIIYTTDRFDELRYQEQRMNDILFLKLSYQFGIYL
ncbi:carbohydrate binding family 9 domain-containing protein [candidate division KSB1 bacterium]|nr:carbohydrate binding family 9 domain-containing protein [candidate division KSB1 bacterium]